MVVTRGKGKRSVNAEIREVKRIRREKYVASKEQTPTKKSTTPRKSKNHGKKLKSAERQLRRSPRLKMKAETKTKAVITARPAVVRRLKKFKTKRPPTVSEMMGAHRNAVVISNIRKLNEPLAVPVPVGRLIVFDTETTGLGVWDRIVEIGAVELIDGKPTGNNYQSYVNCKRKSHWGALNCHGLTREFLSKFRGIAEVVTEFMEYIADSPLLAHNAKFDMRMLNAELRRLRRPQLPNTRAFCSLRWCRCIYAEGRTSLDSICGKFGIDVSHRRIHGALLDSEILAQVVQRLWKITPELNNMKPHIGEAKVVSTKEKTAQLKVPGGGTAPRRRSKRVRENRPKAL